MPILHWLTRDHDIGAAKRVPYRLLQEAPELSAGHPNAGNMLVQGDNLEALKALLPFYSGQVKCIYIDPPYNTRSAFEHYDDNLEHARWLAMMWPRLELLRDLLAEDGSIWVSIDDNEGHYLKVIMDEIFGRKNFITNEYGGRTIRQNQALAIFQKTMIIFLCTRKMRTFGFQTRCLAPTNKTRLTRTETTTHVGLGKRAIFRPETSTVLGSTESKRRAEEL